MCIIVVSPTGIDIPSEEQLKKCFEYNKDGAGFMYNTTKGVQIHKGFLTYPKFRKALAKLQKKVDVKECNIVFHFRIATQGYVDRETTHPYPISDSVKELQKLYILCDYAVAHNGIISFTDDKNNPDLSDSQIFVKDYLANMSKRELMSTKIGELIEKATGSRFCIMNKKKYYLIGDFTEDKGCFYSNTTFRITRYVAPVRNDYYQDNWGYGYAGNYNARQAKRDNYKGWELINGMWEREGDYFACTICKAKLWKSYKKVHNDLPYCAGCFNEITKEPELWECHLCHKELVGDEIPWRFRKKLWCDDCLDDKYKPKNKRKGFEKDLARIREENKQLRIALDGRKSMPDEERDKIIAEVKDNEPENGYGDETPVVDKADLNDTANYKLTSGNTACEICGDINGVLCENQRYYCEKCITEMVNSDGDDGYELCILCNTGFKKEDLNDSGFCETCSCDPNDEEDDDGNTDVTPTNNINPSCTMQGLNQDVLDGYRPSLEEIHCYHCDKMIDITMTWQWANDDYCKPCLEKHIQVGLNDIKDFVRCFSCGKHINGCNVFEYENAKLCFDCCDELTEQNHALTQLKICDGCNIDLKDRWSRVYKELRYCAECWEIAIECNAMAGDFSGSANGKANNDVNDDVTKCFSCGFMLTPTTTKYVHGRTYCNYCWKKYQYDKDEDYFDENRCFSCGFSIKHYEPGVRVINDGKTYCVVCAKKFGYKRDEPEPKKAKKAKKNKKGKTTRKTYCKCGEKLKDDTKEFCFKCGYIKSHGSRDDCVACHCKGATLCENEKYYCGVCRENFRHEEVYDEYDYDQDDDDSYTSGICNNCAKQITGDEAKPYQGYNYCETCWAILTIRDISQGEYDDSKEYNEGMPDGTVTVTSLTVYDEDFLTGWIDVSKKEMKTIGKALDNVMEKDLSDTKKWVKPKKKKRGKRRNKRKRKRSNKKHKTPEEILDELTKQKAQEENKKKFDEQVEQNMADIKKEREKREEERRKTQMDIFRKDDVKRKCSNCGESLSEGVRCYLSGLIHHLRVYCLPCRNEILEDEKLTKEQLKNKIEKLKEIKAKKEKELAQAKQKEDEEEEETRTEKELAIEKLNKDFRKNQSKGEV